MMVLNNKILGIDPKKFEFINFMVENEQLDRFSETEHFYYWFRVHEQVLGSVHKFVGQKPFIYTHKEKNYDLNSYQELSQFIVDIKDVKEIDEVFSGTLPFGKMEHFLRYSKKFKRIDYYFCIHTIVKSKSRTKYFINHKQHKIFSINEKNFVRIYVNNRTCRYISNKNVSHFRGNDKYNNKNKDFWFKVNRRLLNMHLGYNFYKSDQDFLSENKHIQHLSNKFIKGCSSIEEALSKMTKGRPVPKILLSKFPIGEVVSLYHLVEFDEMDKIIKFLYEFHDFFSNLNSYRVVEAYMSTRLGMVVPDRENKCFIRNHSKTKLMNPLDHFELNEPNGLNFHPIAQCEVSDYLRMCIMLDKKANMNIRSPKRLNLEHDELSRKISASHIPKVKTHRSYPRMSSENGFVIELIDEKMRLIEESQIQKHCVKTYATKINRGECCIYSFLEKSTGKRYTLEVQKRKTKDSRKQFFILQQIRGKFNSKPTNKVMDAVSEILRKNNVFISIQEAISKGIVPDIPSAEIPFDAHYFRRDVLEVDDLPF